MEDSSALNIGATCFICKKCGSTMFYNYNESIFLDYLCDSCRSNIPLQTSYSYCTETSIEPIPYQEVINSKGKTIYFKKENDFYYWFFLDKGEVDNEYDRLIQKTQSFEVFMKNFINFIKK